MNKVMTIVTGVFWIFILGCAGSTIQQETASFPRDVRAIHFFNHLDIDGQLIRFLPETSVSSDHQDFMDNLYDPRSLDRAWTPGWSKLSCYTGQNRESGDGGYYEQLWLFDQWIDHGVRIRQYRYPGYCGIHHLSETGPKLSFEIVSKNDYL